LGYFAASCDGDPWPNSRRENISWDHEVDSCKLLNKYGNMGTYV